MVNKKTLFTYKKGAIAEGTTHQKKEILHLRIHKKVKT